MEGEEQELFVFRLCELIFDFLTLMLTTRLALVSLRIPWHFFLSAEWVVEDCVWGRKYKAQQRIDPSSREDGAAGIYVVFKCHGCIQVCNCFSVASLIVEAHNVWMKLWSAVHAVPRCVNGGFLNPGFQPLVWTGWSSLSLYCVADL